jgi:uncharacterized protein (UPF0332 family)
LLWIVLPGTRGTMTKLSNTHLLHIAKGDAKTLNYFRLGVHITTTSGLTIEQLIDNAAKDRFAFARETLRCARRALNDAEPQYRLALARSYYAMYHAARSVVFFIEGGDDHEAHMELPKYIPKDFPDRERWENEIKTARFERNKADYDPYPKSDRAFSAPARSTFETAGLFIAIARRYLVRNPRIVFAFDGAPLERCPEGRQSLLSVQDTPPIGSI